MRPIKVSLTPANENLTGFASNVTGAAFVLTATSSGDGLAHQVSIRNDTANDHSGKTVTLVGTDVDGRALTEVVTGPGASATVESVNYFLTLTSATPSATIGADTFDIGWVDEFASKTIPLDWRQQIGATINVNVTGTIDYTVQMTFDMEIWDEAFKPSQQAQWIDVTALAAKTADLFSQLQPGAIACRIKANSYSSGASLYMNVVMTEDI